jgi:putative SOS response-associated peptidase YedK
LNWGLVPSWLKDNAKVKEFKQVTLNAKAETLKEKPSFKIPYLNRRCWFYLMFFLNDKIKEKKKYLTS